ncbi:MAG: hypothetical protein JWM95_1157 [Gemmatimonadetes bacterium]|nr:hypothetical protein [Gemmatimonadota bacterium]
MQEEGPCFSFNCRHVRLSRILRPEDTDTGEEPIPASRMLVWTLVWIGVLAGVVLYFKYARLLTPLIG